MLSGGVVDWHHHATAQLVYPVSGILSTTTPDGSWVVPGATRAILIPAGLPHHQQAHGPTEMHSLLLPARLDGWAPDRPVTIWVGPLLRELVLRLTEKGAPEGARRDRLIAVLVDELRAEDVPPLLIPQPRDQRLVRLLDSLTDDPAAAAPLTELALRLGTTARTLSRLSREQLGLSYPELRTRVRLLHGLVLLAEGSTVTGTAYACGWHKPSGFIDAFRRFFGTTPAAYQRARSIHPASDRSRVYPVR